MNVELQEFKDGKARVITLEPLNTFTASLPFREVESAIPCGFQIGWFTAADKDGNEFDFTVGAGVGSRWAVLTYRGKSYCFDAGDLLNAMVEAINK